MPGESFINLTEGSGKKAHTFQRVIGANTVEDEYVIPGEYSVISYAANSGSVSTAVASDHLLQIMAGASLHVRIRRISIEQSANATAAALNVISLMRLTTAGTGGGVITPRPFDPADAAAGATAMTLPTVKGTESFEFRRWGLVMRQTVAATGSQVDDAVEWVPLPGTKPLIIPAGVTNGIAIKNGGSAIAAGSLIVTVEFVETSYL